MATLRSLIRLLSYAGLCSIVLQNAQAQSVPGEASPASPNTAELKQQADVLFKRILLKPNDLEAAFRFAEVETALGDEEAAIGSLERMLFYNPNLPRVKVELGILYFRLGSYAMARSYFDALASVDLSPELRERIRGFEEEIDRRLSPSRFAFFAQTGLRYQSNANAGPNSVSVRALGETATLSNDFARRADGNAFVSGGMQYIYDFENQRGDLWETNVTGYYAKQFTVSRLNLGFGEIDTGPRLALGANGFSIRPYVLGSEVSLGDAQYLGQGGGGASLRYTGPNDWLIDFGVEGRARAFSNSAPYPTAHDQRGNQLIVPLAVSGPTALDGLHWQSRFSYVHNTAYARFYGYDQFGFELALPYDFDGPSFAQGHRWTVAPFASVFDVSYAAADGLVDPNVTRHDHIVQGGATLAMPLRDNLGLAVTAQYVETLSNLPNFRTRDFIVSGGPTFRY